MGSNVGDAADVLSVVPSRCLEPDDDDDDDDAGVCGAKVSTASRRHASRDRAGNLVCSEMCVSSRRDARKAPRGHGCGRVRSKSEHLVEVTRVPGPCRKPCVFRNARPVEAGRAKTHFSIKNEHRVEARRSERNVSDSSGASRRGETAVGIQNEHRVEARSATGVSHFLAPGGAAAVLDPLGSECCVPFACITVVYISYIYIYIYIKDHLKNPINENAIKEKRKTNSPGAPGGRGGAPRPRPRCVARARRARRGPS